MPLRAFVVYPSYEAAQVFACESVAMPSRAFVVYPSTLRRKDAEHATYVAMPSRAFVVYPFGLIVFGVNLLRG